MNKMNGLIIILLALLLAACSPDAPVDNSHSEPSASYVTLTEDLAQLKTDFNAADGKIRLVFISGPSCGICLRGLDDLNRSIVASLQNDPRVHTFVVHVPTLGAEEKHVKASIPLMAGPRVSHYWDEVGNSGRQFQEALDIHMYAWDVWMIYEPGQTWGKDRPPPQPVFWQHQLPGLPKDQRLDAEVFAEVLRGKLTGVGKVSDEILPSIALEDEAGLMPVAQPRGVMIQHNHQSRGGYLRLKSISAIRYEGLTEIDGESYPLTIETKRPAFYRRTVRSGDDVSTISRDGTEVTKQGPNTALPASFTNEWLESWEFDGWMTDWKAKGHQVWRLGMKKFGNRLPWVMEAELNNGQTWQIYVDSHTGDAFRQSLIDPDGKETLVLEFGGYRDVDGFRLPHEVRYYEGDRLLAIDRVENISVTVDNQAESTESAVASSQ